VLGLRRINPIDLVPPHDLVSKYLYRWQLLNIASPHGLQSFSIKGIEWRMLWLRQAQDGVNLRQLKPLYM